MAFKGNLIPTLLHVLIPGHRVTPVVCEQLHTGSSWDCSQGESLTDVEIQMDNVGEKTVFEAQGTRVHSPHDALEDVN